MAGLLTARAARPAGQDRLALARFVLLRLATSLAVLWGAVTAAFLLLHLMPGGTADVLLAGAAVTPATRAAIAAQYRLDDPLPLQYATYLGRLLHGDLGDSYVLRQPVRQAIGAQLPATAQLLLATLLVTAAGALLLALATARAGRRVRAAAAAIESLVVALPPFWTGLLLLTVFSFQLRWLPAIGAPGLPGLVLPTLALAAAPTAVIAQVLREGLLRALEEPFATTARARGISGWAVLLRHALRHALLPATALFGWLAGSLVGGAVVVEIVFSRQGIGRLLLSAVQNKDMPVVLALVLLAATVFALLNTAVDVLQWLIDPRSRQAGGAR
ncbi:ABC transporter permease [Kitasatospora sp. NBC_01287]|uniref:ABC transporter permease n=1 Tax=Kitasatospora sp. NBC_01287 TaxID=2903573 RepID=UPI0022543D31|nr:ABC transporter permease [Kitasatospora sp. NBC_01287]MCX4751618.1 ABC transporter permease [Kitasatospora sp. NBC_01287]